MRHLLGVVVAAIILAAAACGDDEPASGGPPGETTPPPTANGIDDGGGRDTFRPPLPDGADPDACVANSNPPIRVFLNRGGGTYTFGQDDSRQNTQPLDETTNEIDAWDELDFRDQDYTKLKKCLDTKFADFNVEVTDQDPGTEDHIEIVFAPESAHILTTPSTVSVRYRSNCSVLKNMTAFVSRTLVKSTVDFSRACGAISQIVGRALGAESVIEEVDAGECTDAMDTKINGCPTAPFTKTPLKCGQAGVIADCECNAGQATQISHDVIAEAAGLRCIR